MPQLWPPNGKLAQVATVGTSDALSGVPPGSLSISATSSEADAGRGGVRSGDIVLAACGAVQVRDERNGAGTGRTYAVTATVRAAAA